MQIVLNNYLTNTEEVIEVSTSEMLPKHHSYHTALEGYVSSKLLPKYNNLKGETISDIQVKLTSKDKSYVLWGSRKIGDVTLKLTGRTNKCK